MLESREGSPKSTKFASWCRRTRTAHPLAYPLIQLQLHSRISLRLEDKFRRLHARQASQPPGLNPARTLENWRVPHLAGPDQVAGPRLVEPDALLCEPPPRDGCLCHSLAVERDVEVTLDDSSLVKVLPTSRLSLLGS